jgi:hypothetical protein
MRRFAGLVMLVVGAVMAACGSGPDGYFDAQSRSWAPLPEEVPMPAAAPDDPAAYRGVRFRMGYGPGGASVESGGGAVRWLRALGGGYYSVPSGAAHFGEQVVEDGRRRMLWFIRVAEYPVPAPPLPPSAEPAGQPPSAVMAVLDVLVLPDGPAGSGIESGCGPDQVIIVGDDGWRLNRSTGRFEPTDPDDAGCPDD